MRVRAFVFVWLLSIPAGVAAQEWEEFTSLQDGFTLNFPGKPTVTDTKWTSQLNYILPGRIYLAEKGKERYSLTVVDYSGIEQQGIERAKTCPPGNANCRANAPEALGAGYARHDERGAIVYATFKLLQRDVKLNYLAWDWQDLVEGHIVQLTNNADQSRTFAWIGMHQQKLYILEGTVPAGYPEPGLFQQSMRWVDKDGKGIRYQSIYSNSFHGMGVYPVPAIVGRGGGGAAATPPPAGR
ncbi:MAG TPA: hypothetical protein VFB92_26575 [Vicinamibacterales bacterium]|nr:hypothetical protein [Vicinamibacterales bacterium]